MSSFDPIWERIYDEGRQLAKYPWDSVVSFVFHHYPRTKPRSEVRIVEIGCGGGSNLWFAAREGFQVAGVDGSASAIEFAGRLLAADGLSGDLRVADFTSLPFESGMFDLAIDRGALTCCGFESARRAVSEVHRVLAPGGKFLCNPYSDAHSSRYAGRPGSDGLIYDIEGGSLTGVGHICFYGRQQVEDLLARGWRLLRLQHLEYREQKGPACDVHAEWHATAEKIAP